MFRGNQKNEWMVRMLLQCLIIAGIMLDLAFLPGILQAQQQPPADVPTPSTRKRENPVVIAQSGSSGYNDTETVFYFGLLVAGVLTWRGLRWYQRRHAASSRDVRQRLIRQIAELDDRYEQSELEAGHYDAERQRLKQQAIQYYI